MSYKTEFPDYDPADMPRIPDGFEDYSWRCDAMPLFVQTDTGVAVWIDYADVAQREFIGDQPRFMVCQMLRDDGGWSHDKGDDLFASDDWTAVLNFMGVE